MPLPLLLFFFFFFPRNKQTKKNQIEKELARSQITKNERDDETQKEKQSKLHLHIEYAGGRIRTFLGCILGRLSTSISFLFVLSKP